ncbi:MAG: FAD-dependent oxidoreductase [Bryobacteraceae bacterium]
MNRLSVDVAIVGGGPAGIAAALELRRRGIARVTLLDREETVGGIPRHCCHPSFGWSEFGRLLSGPAYARKLATAAVSAGVEIRTRHTVVAMREAGILQVATPDGALAIQAERVIVSTGAREMPLAARLISGDRLVGCLTTGALQSFLHPHGLIPFRRPVILGTEIVSLSAVLTCRFAGLRPAAIIEPNARPTVRRPLDLLPRILGIPMYYGAEIADIRGNGRVQFVALQFAAGDTREIACDGVLCTGRFVPEIGVFGGSQLVMDSGSGGPSIDQFGRCSDPVYFAAGNVLRPVETAGWSYEEGRRIGGFVADDLSGRLPAAARGVCILRGSNVKLVVPQRVALPLAGEGLDHLQLRFDRPMTGELAVEADGKCLWRRRVKALPERRVLVNFADLNFPPDPKVIKIGIRE